MFHISVFVNTTTMVVNSYTVLYLCVEVIICQSDRSPESWWYCNGVDIPTILIYIFNKYFEPYVYGCFSFCLFDMLQGNFLKNKTNFDLEDKLLPVPTWLP